MMRRNRFLLHTAPLGSHKLPRTIFGNLFPQETAEGLHRLQELHGMTSNLWIPKHIVELFRKSTQGQLQPIPNAILCDTSTLPGSSAKELALTIGPGHIVLNASHTTQPQLLESYLKDFPPRPTYIPLTVTGAPFPEKVMKHFVEEALRRGFTSPYWIPARDIGAYAELRVGEQPFRDYYNAQQTVSPGSFHAGSCVAYRPHTITCGHFPRRLQLEMAQRAMQWGYTSRLWLTVDEAKRFDCELDPKYAEEGPLVFSDVLSRPTTPGAVSVYYCASQFRHASKRLPTKQQIHLACAGVNIGADKLKGYPPLASRSDADRRAYCQLYTTFPITMDAVELSRIFRHLGQPLREFCLLNGFTKPGFVTSTDVRKHNLHTKEGMEGFHFSSPISRKEMTYFHEEQIVESDVCRQLYASFPVHFLTNQRFFGPLVAQMVEHQSVAQSSSPYWVPHSFLEEAKLTVRSGAFRIRHEAEASYATHNGAKRQDADLNVEFYHADDIVERERWQEILAYKPVSFRQEPYRGRVRMLFLRKAILRNTLHEPMWISRSFLEASGISVHPQTGACTAITSTVDHGGAVVAPSSDGEASASGPVLSIPVADFAESVLASGDVSYDTLGGGAGSSSSGGSTMQFVNLADIPASLRLGLQATIDEMARSHPSTKVTLRSEVAKKKALELQEAAGSSHA